MQIFLNGDSFSIEEDKSTIENLIQKLKLNPEVIIVELNRKIVEKKDYSQKKVNQGDKIEIIQFIGGG